MTAEMTSQAVIKVSAIMSTKMHNSLDTVRGGLGFLFFFLIHVKRGKKGMAIKGKILTMCTLEV